MPPFAPKRPSIWVRGERWTDSLHEGASVVLLAGAPSDAAALSKWIGALPLADRVAVWRETKQWDRAAADAVQPIDRLKWIASFLSSAKGWVCLVDARSRHQQHQARGLSGPAGGSR